jgi:hypothetical protein
MHGVKILGEDTFATSVPQQKVVAKMRAVFSYHETKLLRRCMSYVRTDITMLPMQGKNLDTHATCRQALETTSK